MAISAPHFSSAFFLTGLFLEANGSALRGAQPDIYVPMVEGIAAGQVEREDILAWLSERTA
jgi:prophage maintenance system killer protein